MSTADREIIYAIKMRNEARAAIRQFAGDFTTAFRQIQQASQLLGQSDPFGQLSRSAQQAQGEIRSATSSIVGSFNNMSGAVNASANNATVALGRVQQAARQTAQAVAQAVAMVPAAPAPNRSSRPGGSSPSPKPQPSPVPNEGSGAPGFKNSIREATESVIGMKEALVGVAAAAATFFETREVLRVADEYKALNSQLRLVTNSQQELSSTYEQLFRMANDNRQSLESTVNLYARISKATRELGISQEDVAITTDAIGKAMKSYQGPQQSMEMGIFQFTQGLAAGVLRGQDFRSVLEEMPPLANAIAKGMGITTGTLRAYAEQGKLTSKEVIDAIVSQHDALTQNAAMIQTTAAQSFVVLKNSIVDAVGSADTATGATGKFANSILDLANSLRDPIFTGQLHAFMSSMGTGLTLVTETVQIAVTHIGALSAGLGLLAVRFAIAPMVVAAQIAIAEFGATASVTVAKVGMLRAAMQGLSTAFGGPWGIALTALAGAGIGIAYLSSQMTAAQRAAEALRLSGENLGEAFEKAGNALDNMDMRKKTEDILRLSDTIPDLQTQFTSQFKFDAGKAVYGSGANNDRYPTIRAALQQFNNTSGSTPEANAAALETLRQKMSEIALLAQKSWDEPVRKMAMTILDATKKSSDLAKQLKDVKDRLRYLDGSMSVDEATSYRNRLRGLPNPKDITSLEMLDKSIAEPMDSLRKADPDARKQIEAQRLQTQLAGEYRNALNMLDAAMKNGALDSAEYVRRAKELGNIFEAAKRGATGYTDAIRKLSQDMMKLTIDSMAEGREKNVAQIRQRYEEMAEGFKRAIPAGRELTEILQKVEVLRKTDTDNIDKRLGNVAVDRTRQLDNELAVSKLVEQSARARLQYEQQLTEEARKAGASDPKGFVERGMRDYDERQPQIARNTFDNGTLRDSIRSLSEESATLGMTTRERERYAAGMKIADEARRAGLSTWDQELQQFYKEYDALQKAKDAYNTFGQGLKTALDERLEATRNVAQESAKFWTSTFDNMENTLVDFVRTGKLNMSSFLASIAADFARFSVRQLMSSFLGSVFGTPGTGGGAGTGIFGAAGAGLFSGLFGATRTNTNTVPTSAAGNSILTPGAPLGSGPTSPLSGLGSFLRLSNSGVQDAITNAAAVRNIPVADLATMAKIESGFDPNDVTHSNKGLMQFSSDQFKSLGISNPFDPAQSANAAALEWTQNRSALSSYLGRDPTSAELYVAHQQGLAGAKSLIGGDQSMSAVDAIEKYYPNRSTAISAITGNGGSADMTKQQFNDMWANRWQQQQAQLYKNGSLTDMGIEPPKPVQVSELAPLQQSIPQVQSDFTNAFQNVANTTQNTFGGTFTQLSGNFSQTMGQSIQGVGSQFSNMFSGMGSAGGSAGGGGGLFSWIGSLFGFHRGGLVGSSGSLSRTVNMAAWAGAPKFHTGGIVGGNGLQRGERPIIAKDNEAVMPTVRMPDGSFGVRAIGAGNASGGVTNHTSINVNVQGSSGDSQKDQEMARQVANQVDRAVQRRMQEFAQNQQRPGGMFSSMSAGPAL